MNKIVIKHTWGTRIFNSTTEALEFIQTCTENKVRFEVTYKDQ